MLRHVYNVAERKTSVAFITSLLLWHTIAGRQIPVAVCDFRTGAIANGYLVSLKVQVTDTILR